MSSVDKLAASSPMDKGLQLSFNKHYMKNEMNDTRCFVRGRYQHRGTREYFNKKNKGGKKREQLQSWNFDRC